MIHNLMEAGEHIHSPLNFYYETHRNALVAFISNQSSPNS